MKKRGLGYGGMIPVYAHCLFFCGSPWLRAGAGTGEDRLYMLGAYWAF